ncbi:MAG: IS4 family transposase, partial [Myxococcaceae bacterium]|nr:IS4 family transposase [Myxococcaceae bacterium]
DAPAAIREAFFDATKRRLAGPRRVLAVQDTTGLDLAVGPLHVHSTLAVTLQGVPVGLLSQFVWARDPADPGTRHRRKTTPIDQKESLKWLLAWEESQRGLPLGTQLIHVGEREADVYDLFLHAVQSPPHQLLVRACRDRKTDDETRHLFGELEALPVQDAREVQLPRAGKRAPRQAVLSLRYKRVVLHPPKHRTGEKLPKIVVDAIWVQEYAPPAGETAVEWLLLTTAAVECVADAWERVEWYGYRWRVERYHFVLKSGCKIEERQLETVSRMSTCLAVYSVVASRLLELTYAAREHPREGAGSWVSREEWEVLWLRRPPAEPIPPAPTVREVVREIAGLGGFQGRKGDGEPGVKTLWE